MNIQKHINEIFSDYQESPALDDFKEEISTHLNERIKSLIKKGMDEKSAFSKATGELGDISIIANDIAKKRKQEVFSEMYMQTKNYISAKRSALYALCGLGLGFAILTSLIIWFNSGLVTETTGAVLAFGMTSVLGFVFLGLTQETAANEAMKWKRALLYVLAVGLILFAILSGLISYFLVAEVAEFNVAAKLAGIGTAENVGIIGAIGILMVFALPGIALGIFLILTEKDRSKPWMAKLRQEAIKREAEQFSGLVGQVRFGLLCGALWIAAIAGFVVLSMTAGFKFSWLAIVAALVIQMVIMAILTKSK